MIELVLAIKRKYNAYDYTFSGHENLMKDDRGRIKRTFLRNSFFSGLASGMVIASQHPATP